jgi:thiol-disulfide isomerase/thioredoxin
MVFKKVHAAFIAAVLYLMLSPCGLLAGSARSDAYILPAGGISEGDPVPYFHAKAIDGEDISLDNLLISDKKIVLAFWSMYCSACVEKFNSMIAIQKKYENEGVFVISVNTDGEYRRGEGAIRNFISEFETRQGVKVNFPVLYDETNWLALAMNIDFLPMIITVDGKGRVHKVYRKFGEGTDEKIYEGIEVIVKALIAYNRSLGEERRP